MADGALTLILSEEMAERLKAAARAAGVTPESLALQHLDQALNDTAFDTGEAERRLADYDKTGRHVGFEEWASDFRMDASSRGQT